MVEGAPCYYGTFNMDETPASVRLDYYSPPTPSPCPGAIYETVTINLQAPLAGRQLLGSQPAQMPRPIAGGPVPHVVGLSSGEAVDVLRTAGYEPRVLRRRTTPGRRRVLFQDGVRLVLSRPPT